MQRHGTALILSPSDLINSTACAHLVQLDRMVAFGELRRDDTTPDAQTEAIARRGDEHERRYLDMLRKSGRVVTTIARPGPTTDDLRAGEMSTRAAMQQGCDIIYQPVFFDGVWRGQADFLVRVETPSQLGAWSYEVIDTKLARHAKPTAVLQLCIYAQHVQRLQGVLPHHVHVELGSGQRESFVTSEYIAYTRQLQRSLEQTLQGPAQTTYPHPVIKCAQCTWESRCETQRRNDDHLAYVANMRRSQIEKLAAAGIHTVAAFVASTPDARTLGIGDVVLQRLHHQATLQMKQRHDTRDGERAQVSYTLLPQVEGRGLALLPEPCVGDIFFDMEGDPLVDDVGLEYLFGAITIDDGQQKFHAFWAHDRAQEKKAFEDFVDFIATRRARWPALHVYHYAPYEPVALGKLAMRHATREDAVDTLLRQNVLVDLYQVVRQSLLVSQESYSIKKLEPLYMPERQAAVKDAGSSIVEYEHYLELLDADAPKALAQEVLDNIEHYNKEDCISTELLHKWLEQRRETSARPAPPTVSPPAAQAANDEAEALGEALRRTVPEANRTEAQQAVWLLSHLLLWHRREAKPEWWSYFERKQMNEMDQYYDGECLTGLVYDGIVGTELQSNLYQFHFDAAQEHKIVAGRKYEDAGTGKILEVFSVDRARGLICIKRSKKSEVPACTTLLPCKPIDAGAMQKSLLMLAQQQLHQSTPGPALDLLSRRPPRLTSGTLPGAHANVEMLQDVVLRLDNSTLPVQGPPGAGKTFVGARMIAALLQAGKRVGITANSYAVIGNLLREVMHIAQPVARAMLKADEDKLDPIEGATMVSKSEHVEEALQNNTVNLVAGTAWLMAREKMRGQLDTLFVDEAGQMSLANVVAVSPCARNLVLLGDPRQLSQPGKGTHPDGVGVAALTHVLGAQHTISAEQGIFLPTSRRMHPDICRFISEVVYDGKLEAYPACANQRIEAEGALNGHGLRWAAVHHVGCSTYSTQEAETIAQLADELLGRTWIDQNKQAHTLGPADILVVAPFNVQVGEIQTKAPLLRVGTVDKFQGQQAPVVFYSMTCSTAEDAPRDMEFLYELERLNVAISRAQCLTVLVCTPQLLLPNCRKVTQMRLANAVCRFVEMAKPL